MYGYIQPAGFAFNVDQITSGAIGSGDVASGAVQGFFGTTRNIASGTVGSFDFGSGAVVAGTVGSGAVQSGNIASGSIGPGHLSSGAVSSGQVASGVAVTYAGLLANSDFVANEVISGVRCVAFNQSGQLIIAQPGVSGTMPAVGVATANFASGATVTYFRDGPIFSTNVSGFNFSGFPGRLAYVGLSGIITSLSGVPVASGNEQQSIGTVISESGLMLRIL